MGDIDVLIIDHTTRKVFLVECKKTEVAKNVKQLVQEVNHLFGSEESEGWLVKHEERFKWVKENMNFLESKYSLDLKGYTVHASIVTSEELPTKFLKKDSLPFPMISFYTIKDSKNPCQILISG